MDDLRHRVRDHFSTVYITIASVLLGLSLADIVALLRDLEQHSVFVWLQALAIIHLIFNAWYAYSGYATIIYAVPTVWDSLSVFLLSAAHFAMAAFVGSSADYFCFAIAVYATVAIGSIYYSGWRMGKVSPLEIRPTTLAPAMIVNAIAAPFFAAVGTLFNLDYLGPRAEIVVGIVIIAYATTWLVVYTHISNKYVIAKLFESE